MTVESDIDLLLADIPAPGTLTAIDDQGAGWPAPRPSRDLSHIMRKIPITLTLEVGSTRVSLQDLLAIASGSVLELDRLAGEPLVIKVNGTPIGHGEVVVSGENYGLKVIDLDGLDAASLTP